MAMRQILLVSLGILALVTFCHSLALTTFGKSNQQNNNNYNNQNNERQSSDRPPARECISDSECAAIRGTSCLEPIFNLNNVDGKLRCLCGDYMEPKNGACDNKYKRVKVQCNSDDECTAGAQCLKSNITSVPGYRCWCKQGYEEDEDMLCNGSPLAFGYSALSLVAGLLLAGNV